MRYFVLSDIHSNTEALDACIRQAKLAGYDSVLCCGDIVGYGPNPKEAIDMIRSLDPVIVRGNHDRVAAGIDEPTAFNSIAREAINWTRSVLPDSYREYLKNLPPGPVEATADAQLVHGAMGDEDDYIFTETDAAENFRLTERRITFFGHSHFTVVFTLDEAGNAFVAPNHEHAEFTVAKCNSPGRFFVNPGSVGQPRDGDWRASFALWDSNQGRIEFHRVEYAIQLTQAKMQEARLPRYLIERLSYGR